ncbi:MAG: 50S ribosomal protein L35 [Phycisphaerales bacterium]|nr:MAG: 50S ribosomal protein L35 [Phycisphaerales bacterium]
MPKNKSHKAILKRIRVTKTGLVKHKRCGGKHLRSDKPGSRLRKFRIDKFMPSGEAKRLEKMLHRRLRGRDQPRTTSRRSPSPAERAAIKAARKAAASL